MCVGPRAHVHDDDDDDGEEEEEGKEEEEEEEEQQQQQQRQWRVALLSRAFPASCCARSAFTYLPSPAGIGVH